MSGVNRKANYVLAAKNNDGRHHCHWPGCKKSVPPAMWGCRPHWYQLPAYLRTKIWHAYQPGQEISKRPSTDYIAAATEVQEWIAAHIASQPEEQSDAQQSLI